MAKVFKGICVEDFVIEAQNGDRLELKRGTEYTISQQWETSEYYNEPEVTVFSNYWARCPARLFAGVLPL